MLNSVRCLYRRTEKEESENAKRGRRRNDGEMNVVMSSEFGLGVRVSSAPAIAFGC